MSSITNQSTKKLEQGINAALPNAEFSSRVFESGSQANEVWDTFKPHIYLLLAITDRFVSPQGLQNLGKEIEHTPGAGRQDQAPGSNYAGGGIIWNNKIKVRG